MKSLRWPASAAVVGFGILLAPLQGHVERPAGAGAVTTAPGAPSVSSPPSAGGLELSDLVRRFPPHREATYLYLNFDGWKGQAGHPIQPFEGTTGRRARDIQEILYRTAQVFAPFNVRVVRIQGDANYDRGPGGHTTIFVGADAGHLDDQGRKYPRASTPHRFTDYPNAALDTGRAPHSLPYHIAFIDPVGTRDDGTGRSAHWDNTTISRKISHEAGHTFGLAHTLTDGYPDLMGYYAKVRTFFGDRTLPISDLNNDSARDTKVRQPSHAPRWHDTPVATQNAYR
jgi:hypothetical protein